MNEYTLKELAKHKQLIDLTMHKVQIEKAKARYDIAVDNSIDDATIIIEYSKVLNNEKVMRGGVSAEIDNILADDDLILSTGIEYYNNIKARNQTLYTQAFNHLITLKNNVTNIENLEHNSNEKQDYIYTFNNADTLLKG